MSHKGAAAGLVLAVAVGVGLVAGGPTEAATQVTLSPASGPPGTEFVVTGTGFAALPVEIRWGGLTGPVIATAMGPAFSVTAVVPDSPPNSHPVMAVVTDGNAVSTSSASFQVTGGKAPAPVDTTTTTTTEVTTTTAAAPAGTTVPEPAAGGTGRGTGLVVRGASSGVEGGIDGGETAGDGATGGGTTTGSGPASATPASAGSTVAAPATTFAAAEATVPTVTTAGAPAPAPGNGQPASTAPLLPGDGVTSAALAPRSTSQSAGAVSNPALLLLGLSLVFGGGAFLAVRNRHRA